MRWNTTDHTHEAGGALQVLEDSILPHAHTRRTKHMSIPNWIGRFATGQERQRPQLEPERVSHCTQHMQAKMIAFKKQTIEMRSYLMPKRERAGCWHCYPESPPVIHSHLLPFKCPTVIPPARDIPSTIPEALNLLQQISPAYLIETSSPLDRHCRHTVVLGVRQTSLDHRCDS